MENKDKAEYFIKAHQLLKAPQLLKVKVESLINLLFPDQIVSFHTKIL